MRKNSNGKKESPYRRFFRVPARPALCGIHGDGLPLKSIGSYTQLPDLGRPCNSGRIRDSDNG